MADDTFRYSINIDEFDERAKNAPKIEVGESGIVLDNYSDINTLNMNEQPEIVHAALQAVNSIDIPNSYIRVHEIEQYGGSIVFIDQRNETLLPSDTDIPRTTLLRSELSEGNQDVFFPNGDTRHIGTSISVQQKEDGMTIRLRVVNEGHLPGRGLDVQSEIHYDFDNEGNITDRQTAYYNNGVWGDLPDTAQEPGQWTIRTVEALENNFARILGGDNQVFIDSQRPDTAATHADAPFMIDAIPLSTINLNGNATNMELNQADNVVRPAQ